MRLAKFACLPANSKATIRILHSIRNSKIIITENLKKTLTFSLML